MSAPVSSSRPMHRVLLTGASGGIGLATAAALATSRVHLHAVVRTERAASKVRAALLAVAPDASVDFHLTDLASLAEVHALVATLLSAGVSLDGLVLNAAAPPPRHHEVTIDGFERQVAVGYLAHFALATGLLPMLTREAGARVVVVASQVAYGATLDVAAMEALRAGDRERGITGGPYHPVHTYGAVKLANVLFAVGLARRLQACGGTAVCLHPGVVRTRLLDALATDAEEPSPLTRAIAPVRAAVGRTIRRLRPANPEPRWWDTPEEAAARIAEALLSPALRARTGMFLQDGAERPLPDLASDEQAVERLWHISEQLVAGQGNPQAHSR